MKKAVLCITILLAVISGKSSFAVSFQGLGDLPGGGYRSYAYGVSGDGSVAVGYSESATAYHQAFRWTAGGGMVGLLAYTGYGASSDGSVIVGDAYLPTCEAFRWTADGGVVGLGYLSGAIKSGASGVSADGSVIVGYSGTSPTVNEATLWMSGGSMIGLGYLTGGSSLSYASGVSSDGSIVVGYSSSALGDQAFRWTSGSGMVGLNDLAGGSFGSYANAVSADGSVIVGSGSSLSGQEAFRWTAQGGMVGLGGINSKALAVSANGSVIVGQNSSGAFYWTESDGMQNLKDMLISLGADLTAWNGKTWTLSAATGISADGKTIVGYGFNDQSPEAWIATIPEPATLLLLGLGMVILRRKR